MPGPVDPALNGLWYGNGCGGQGGQPVTITASPALRPGYGSTLSIENLPPNTSAMILFGFSASVWHGLPLPLPLSSLGLTGCELLVSPDLVFWFGSGNGAITANIGLPPIPELTAHSLFAQVVFHQPAANPGGVGFSRGYATTIGRLPMSAATRTTGVAPLAVTFDATGPGCGIVQPFGSAPDYASFGYEWRYGDPASGNWPHNGKSKNKSVGWIGAHVYEQPGTYVATLRVTTVGGATIEYEQVIVVTDPSVVFANRTFYVAANGSNTNPGSQSQPFQSIDKGIDVAFAGGQTGRVLFRRGDTFSTSNLVTLGSGTQPGSIGAYGSGARPQLQFANAQGAFHLGARRDLRLVDLDLRTVAPNMLSYARGATLGTETTLLNCKFENFGYGLDASYTNRATVCGCEVLGNVEYGLYAYGDGVNSGRNLAVLGTRFESAGLHLTRVYIDRSIFMANRYGTAHFTAMTWVGRNAGSPPARLNCILDNYFTTDTQDIVAMGPANAQFNEHASDNLFEGNRFYNRATTPGSCFRIRGSRVAIRNNVFDVLAHTAIHIAPWSSSPVPPPSDIKVEHNTCYRSSGSPMALVTSQSANATLVRNNLLFCPQGGYSVATGNVTTVQNLTTNPLFTDASTGDFRLAAGSPALDVAVPSMVRTDFNLVRRPTTLGADVGAYER